MKSPDSNLKTFHVVFFSQMLRPQQKKLVTSHYNTNISKLLFYARFTFQYDLFSRRIINPAINCCSQLGSLHKEVTDHLDKDYGPFPLTALAHPLTDNKTISKAPI